MEGSSEVLWVDGSACGAKEDQTLVMLEPLLNVLRETNRRFVCRGLVQLHGEGSTLGQVTPGQFVCELPDEGKVALSSIGLDGPLLEGLADTLKLLTDVQ